MSVLTCYVHPDERFGICSHRTIYRGIQNACILMYVVNMALNIIQISIEYVS